MAQSTIFQSFPHREGGLCVRAFVLNVPQSDKVIWRRGPQLKVSSDRLVKPEIEPPTPGLQSKWYIYNTTETPALADDTHVISSLIWFVKAMTKFENVVC